MILLVFLYELVVVVGIIYKYSVLLYSRIIRRICVPIILVY